MPEELSSVHSFSEAEEKAFRTCKTVYAANMLEDQVFHGELYETTFKTLVQTSLTFILPLL